MALMCSNRSIPFPRSLLRSDGSRSSFSTAAVGIWDVGDDRKAGCGPECKERVTSLAPSPMATTRTGVFGFSGAGTSPR
jgi:hypothetical protein